VSRKQKEPLRPLLPEERIELEQIARTQSWPAIQVAHAKSLLAVADGAAFTQAAQAAGRKSGDAVGQLVARFNAQGVAAVVPGHGGGTKPLYTAAERTSILSCARRTPDREQDGTATWSLTTLQRSLRGELPKISTYTIWCVLHEAGLSWQKSRTWCDTGTVQRLRRRRDGTMETVRVTDPDAEAKKS
jgi:transposase